MADNLVGSQLGKYQIQAEIGKGGMGLVYLGYDPMLDRRVAIKVLAPHLIWETGFVERFLREARAAARLKHAGIVTIYDVGQEGNCYYIVMEYLEGYTLSHLIIQRGPLSSKQALPILRQLADALDCAHGYGLVHRDIKPGNVVVNAAGQTTLTDFGVARAAQETRLTATGALVGTPQYMSPEQALGEDVDHRTDIYSLGVLAYEMMGGRAPFGATTPHAVLHQLIYDPPPSILSLRPDLPADVDRVLNRALAKEPADRYQSAKEFVGALQQALEGQARSIAPRPERVGEAPRRSVPSPKPRRSAASAATSRSQAGAALWLGWVLASVVGWAVGWVLAPFAGEAVGFPVGRDLDSFVAEIAGGLASGTVIGLAVGVPQWLVLRRYVRGAGWWMLATTAAWAVIGSVKWAQGLVMDEVLFATMGWLEEVGWAMVGALIGVGMGMVFEALTGLVIGLVQWLVLRRRVWKAGRWVWLSALAWAAVAAVMGGIGWALAEPEDEMMHWFMLIVGGFVPGIITATGLTRFLPRRGGTGLSRHG